MINQQTNNLINEKSPYLLQHANNPVNWYPWGAEAFEKAKKENKPIFLSIGYSTCHWCHVMAHESFEDETVARILNDNFISIKVDREERPDIDHIYMTFCQMLTGQGGWPLSIFMTYDKKPFYGGTYFPKDYKYGRLGFIQILTAINKEWKDNPSKILESGEKVVETLNQQQHNAVQQDIQEEAITKAYNNFVKNYDSVYGGFSKAPKFPSPHQLLFLLRYAKLNDELKALEMVEKTLVQMYKGGIFDHVGFGFSRYATDQRWLIPHFEKMLYDNALLMIAYTEAYQYTKKPLYKEVVDKIAVYITENMLDNEGGFYSAEDADSEGVEGKFYVWDLKEVLDILGPEDTAFFTQYYKIPDNGNFEGHTIINLLETDIDTIDEITNDKLAKLLHKLNNVREGRIRPHKDDKILTSWNGLMITAFAIAGRVLGNREYVNTAKRAMSFIETNLTNDSERLMARYREGEVKYLGYIDDYATLLWANIELYESTFESLYIHKCEKLVTNMMSLFWNDHNYGFFINGRDGETLITQSKEIYDGAMPSGNAIAAYNILRLSKLTGNKKYEAIVEQYFKAFGKEINAMPIAYAFTLMTYMYYRDGGREIVIAPIEDVNKTQIICNSINEKYLPFSTIILNNEQCNIFNELIKEKQPINHQTAVYICEHFSCQQPITDIKTLETALSD